MRGFRAACCTVGLLPSACVLSNGCRVMNRDGTSDASSDLPDFDKLWDYNDPAGTAEKFREILPAARESGNRPYLAELLTQIARTQGLQREFDAAHATLDEVETLLADDAPIPRIRVLLERGRVFNSSSPSTPHTTATLRASRTRSAGMQIAVTIHAAIPSRRLRSTS